MYISAWTSSRSLRKRAVPCIVSDQYVRKSEEEGCFTVSEIIADSTPKDVGERLDLIMSNLAILSGDPGVLVGLSEKDKYLCFSKTMPQLSFFMSQLEARGWLTWQTGANPTTCLTADGWNRVAELHRSRRESEQAFVAMAFTGDLEDAWHDGFHPGVIDAGLKPLRLDKKEHNEKICDLIILEISRSRVVIADVTHHRQGVYFEAGFAMGLRIPVVWTCRQDQKSECHFDTRQYNHIFWSDVADLRKRLTRRIQATIL